MKTHASATGILRAGEYFGFQGIANATSIDDIEGVAHELGHWVALGHSRRPPDRERVVRVPVSQDDGGVRFQNALRLDAADLGTSIDRELNRMSLSKRNRNEIYASAVSLGAIKAMGLRLPRGVYGKVFGALEYKESSKELPFTGSSATRKEVLRVERTRRGQRLIRRLLRIIEEFS